MAIYGVLVLAGIFMVGVGVALLLNVTWQNVRRLLGTGLLLTGIALVVYATSADGLR